MPHPVAQRDRQEDPGIERPSRLPRNQLDARGETAQRICVAVGTIVPALVCRTELEALGQGETYLISSRIDPRKQVQASMGRGGGYNRAARVQQLHHDAVQTGLVGVADPVRVEVMPHPIAQRRQAEQPGVELQARIAGHQGERWRAAIGSCIAVLAGICALRLRAEQETRWHVELHAKAPRRLTGEAIQTAGRERGRDLAAEPIEQPNRDAVQAGLARLLDPVRVEVLPHPIPHRGDGWRGQAVQRFVLLTDAEKSAQGGHTRGLVDQEQAVAVAAGQPSGAPEQLAIVEERQPFDVDYPHRSDHFGRTAFGVDAHQLAGTAVLVGAAVEQSGGGIAGDVVDVVGRQGGTRDRDVVHARAKGIGDQPSGLRINLEQHIRAQATVGTVEDAIQRVEGQAIRIAQVHRAESTAAGAKSAHRGCPSGGEVEDHQPAAICPVKPLAAELESHALDVEGAGQPDQGGFTRNHVELHQGVFGRRIVGAVGYPEAQLRAGLIDQREVEREVIAGVADLMHFNREHVVASDEPTRIDGKSNENLLEFVVDGRCRPGTIIDRSGRHVAARDFLPVQINDRAIIAQQAELQGAEDRWIRDGEMMAKVGRQVTGGGRWAKADRGHFSVAAITQPRRAARPAAVVESWRGPGCALVRAVVEITPDRTLRHDNFCSLPRQASGQTSTRRQKRRQEPDQQ